MTEKVLLSVVSNEELQQIKYSFRLKQKWHWHNLYFFFIPLYF